MRCRAYHSDYHSWKWQTISWNLCSKDAAISILLLNFLPQIHDTHIHKLYIKNHKRLTCLSLGIVNWLISVDIFVDRPLDTKFHNYPSLSRYYWASSREKVALPHCCLENRDSAWVTYNFQSQTDEIREIFFSSWSQHVSEFILIITTAASIHPCICFSFKIPRKKRGVVLGARGYTFDYHIFDSSSSMSEQNVKFVAHWIFCGRRWVRIQPTTCMGQWTLVTHWSKKMKTRIFLLRYMNIIHM